MAFGRVESTIEIEASPDIKERMGHAEITSLIYYPIKGCRGIETNHARVLRTGLKNDRRLMLTYPGGRFVSQREKNNVRLAQVQPLFLEENVLQVDAPNTPTLHVEVTRGGSPFAASVHSTKDIMVVDQGRDAQKWFTEFLGYDVQLVTMAADYHRQVSQRWSENPDDETYFADGYPILLTADESLGDLNTLLPQSIPMNRFRPNIVIAGSGIAYGEEQLRKIRVGTVQLDIVKPCTRCLVPSGEQIEGIRDHRDGMKGEPLKTLMKYRRIKLKTGDIGGVFGQNLIPINEGDISVGQKIEVIETQPAPTYD